MASLFWYCNFIINVAMMVYNGLSTALINALCVLVAFVDRLANNFYFEVHLVISCMTLPNHAGLYFSISVVSIVTHIGRLLLIRFSILSGGSLSLLINFCRVKQLVYVHCCSSGVDNVRNAHTFCNYY